MIRLAGNSIQPGRSVTSKVTGLLRCFLAGGDHSLSELARLGGLPVSTTHRLVNELIDAGVLDRGDDGTYRIGAMLSMLQPTVSSGSTAVFDHAPSAVTDVAVAIGRPAVFGVLRDGGVIGLRSGPDGPIGAGRGHALPAHATAVGKALLAFAPAAVVKSVLAQGLRPFTEHTKIDPMDLRHTLAVIRLTQVATADGELRPGVREVAVPVFAPGGRAIGAIGTTATSLEQVRLTLVPLLTVAAKGITRQLAASRSPERELSSDVVA